MVGLKGQNVRDGLHSNGLQVLNVLLFHTNVLYEYCIARQQVEGNFQRLHHVSFDDRPLCVLRRMPAV